jgi:hypothetical protein
MNTSECLAETLAPDLHFLEHTDPHSFLPDAPPWQAPRTLLLLNLLPFRCVLNADMDQARVLIVQSPIRMQETTYGIFLTGFIHDLINSPTCPNSSFAQISQFFDAYPNHPKNVPAFAHGANPQAALTTSRSVIDFTPWPGTLTLTNSAVVVVPLSKHIGWSSTRRNSRTGLASSQS